MKSNNAIIFLNGDMPRIKVARKYVKKDSLIICADGGANKISKFRLNPDLIIGDMDSIDSSRLKDLTKKNTRVIKIKEQETTDFEKCLIFCLKNNLEDISVFGGASPRADHTLNNYSVMKRYSKKLNISMVDDTFEISFINRNIRFNYKKGELVSLLPLPKAFKVKTKGLKYPLDNEDLEFGTREGTLNVSSASNVSVSFEKGALLLFKQHFL
ncbi:MAG: thiamine diphosphokinase [Ignavibacteriae bacterium]|nr:thiamine diphosphokinase [Ignavibacteriota bacterium]